MEDDALVAVLPHADDGAQFAVDVNEVVVLTPCAPVTACDE